jgi:hypothetical protein
VPSTPPLVAALSAFSFEDAYGDKLRSQWKEFWEKSRTDPNAQPPTSNRVPVLSDLLAMAEAGSPSLQPLQLTQEQRADITELSTRRHDLEHVKPESLAIDTTHLPRIAKNVAAVFDVLSEAFSHHLELDEIDQADAALRKLKATAT